MAAASLLHPATGMIVGWPFLFEFFDAPVRLSACRCQAQESQVQAGPLPLPAEIASRRCAPHGSRDGTHGQCSIADPGTDVAIGHYVMRQNCQLSLDDSSIEQRRFGN